MRLKSIMTHKINCGNDVQVTHEIGRRNNILGAIESTTGKVFLEPTKPTLRIVFPRPKNQ